MYVLRRLSSAPRLPPLTLPVGVPTLEAPSSVWDSGGADAAFVAAALAVLDATEWATAPVGALGAAIAALGSGPRPARLRHYEQRLRAHLLRLVRLLWFGKAFSLTAL